MGYSSVYLQKGSIMKIKNVLSLFDGISCGQLALKRSGIKYEKYYSSEIDKFAITITQKNFPKTIQLGDINNYKEWNLPNIDLLIGGSPCQNLSTAYSKNTGLYGEKSILFFKFVEIMNLVKPKYFLFENVNSMSMKNRNIISSYLGVEPIMLDSSLVSGQSRKRLYWTNIPIILPLIDKHIMLRDVMDEHEWRDLSKWCFGYYGKVQRKSMMSDYYGKMRTLTTKNIHPSMYVLKDNKMCTLTPIEFERLQTLDENYTYGIPNTERFKTIGNGWTVDIIKYIFDNLKIEIERNNI